MNLDKIMAKYAKKQARPLRDRAVYGVVDTTFAVCRQGPRAVHQLREHGVPYDRIQWVTVPGFKDLGVAARQLLDGGCDIVIACGMAGPEEIDKQCAQDASIGLQMCQQATAKPILEVIIHMDEADGQDLIDVVDNRVREHATNAFWMMEDPAELTLRSGTGQRQGFEDVGSLESQVEAKDS